MHVSVCLGSTHYSGHAWRVGDFSMAPARTPCGWRAVCGRQSDMCALILCCSFVRNPRPLLAPGTQLADITAPHMLLQAAPEAAADAVTAFFTGLSAPQVPA